MQGERKLKDFDIRTAAGGVDESWTRKFNASVEDGILEVRFQYAGKGTTAVPRRGSYGPLVSAISFEASNTTITLWFTYFSFIDFLRHTVYTLFYYLVTFYMMKL